MKEVTRRRLAVAGMVLGSLAVNGCANEAAGPLSAPAGRWSAADSARLGMGQWLPPSLSVQGTTSAACSGDPTDDPGCPVGIIASPGYFQGFTQPGPITLRFSVPVGTVTVSGTGAISCSGTYGTLVGYDADGAEAGSVALTLRSPSDCGEDDVTFGARATLVAERPITSAVILPMAPVTFPVFDLVGRASASYTVSVTRVRDEDEFRVTCTPVLRGEPTTCTASVVPESATLAVQGWSFTSTDPAVEFSLERADNPTDTEWKGEGVVSGTVMVWAEVDGKPDTATSTLDVTARDWTNRSVPYQFREDSPGALPAIPTDAEDLGRAVFVVDFTKADVARPIVGGPNDGLVYFTDTPFTIDVTVSINTVALKRGSDFWRMQPPRRTQMGGTTYCARSEVEGAISGVKAHEGMARTDRNSHVQVFLDTFDREAGPRTEALVGTNPDVTALRADLAKRATAESYRVAHDPATNPYRSACVFNYDPTRKIR